MFSTIKRIIATIVDKIASTIHDLATAIRDWLVELWNQHRERIATNPDYAAAIGLAAAAVTKLFTSDPALLAVVAALSGLYIAIHHVTGRSPWRSSSNPWEPSQKSWDDDPWDDAPH